MTKEKLNLKKEILTIKGEKYPMTYPSTLDIEKVQKLLGKDEIQIDELPKETVQNVLINSIAGYDPEEKKEVFMVNQLANWVMNGEKEDGSFEKLNDNLYQFLVEKVLPYATVMSKINDSDSDSDSDKKRGNGIYFAWVMAQVYNELGVND